MGEERIQKLLSSAGIASRRACDELVRAGRVAINGRKAVVGVKADATRDIVEVDGKRVQVNPRRRYLMLNKPAGYVVTASDPQGRQTVLDLVNSEERLFPAGRLDAATEGLLLITNDGDLTNRLLHPRYEVERVYLAEVRGRMSRKQARAIELGTAPGVPRVDARLRIKDGTARSTLVEVAVKEGRNHLVRKMFAGVGHPVLRLVRVSFGPLRLGRLRSGTHRALTPFEIQELFRSAGL